MSEQDGVVGRSVIYRRWRTGETLFAVVEKWEPLSHALCDALLRFEDGSLCWVGLSECRPAATGESPLPDRRAAVEEAARRTRESLAAIFADHVRAHLAGERWRGCDFARALVGNAVARALKDADGDPRAVLEAVLAEDPRRLKRVGGVLTVDPGVAGSIPPDVLDHRRVR